MIRATLTLLLLGACKSEPTGPYNLCYSEAIPEQDCLQSKCEERDGYNYGLLYEQIENCDEWGYGPTDIRVRTADDRCQIWEVCGGANFGFTDPQMYGGLMDTPIPGADGRGCEELFLLPYCTNEP